MIICSSGSCCSLLPCLNIVNIAVIFNQLQDPVGCTIHIFYLHFSHYCSSFEMEIDRNAKVLNQAEYISEFR